MADITITHTHEDGTLLDGSRKGDDVLDIVRQHGFTWKRGRGICINVSRDRDARTWHIDGAAAALREAGHDVTIEIDNTPRPTAIVEAERAGRAEDRAESLGERARKADAAGDARLAAARRITDGIPFGQPVQPPGHHSRNAHLNALDRADRHRGKAAEEWRKAEHLAGRSQGVVANQQHRLNPRTTMRRIEELEKQIRAHQRTIDGYRRNFRNNSGEIYQVETHTPAGPAYRGELEAKIDSLHEQIAYWRQQLAEQAESGAFVQWTRTDFVKGDHVRYSGFDDWYPVTRVNAKSVSVTGGGWPNTISWDKVAGRRRDGMQWDAPNGEPWPVELARKVSRWLREMEPALTRNGYGDDVMRERIRVDHAQKIVLGLPADAGRPEVAVCIEGIDGVETKRNVLAAFVDVYDRLAAGERFPDIRAAFIPIEVRASWRMPDREPQRRPAARDLLTRHDVPAVKAGDLIAGFYSNHSERVISTFSGPVVQVSEINDRRERGRFVTIRLASGDERTVATHEWLAVHPAGTWEEPSAIDARPPTTGVEGMSRLAETSRPTADPSGSAGIATPTVMVGDEPGKGAPDPWGPVLDAAEAARTA